MKIDLNFRRKGDTKLVRKLKKKETQLKAVLVRMKDNDYIINFDNYTGQIMERYYKALELLEKDNFKEAALIFKNLINNVEGHFDSIVALIGIYNNDKDIPNISKTFNKGIKDMKYILSVLPQDAKLPWAYSSNKGFLRFMYNLGIKYMEQGKLEDAKDIFIKLYNLDNEDSLNTKEVLGEILLRQEKYQEIIDLTSTEEIDNISIFNRILALIALNKKEEAKSILFSLGNDAVKFYSYLKETEDNAKQSERYISYDLSRNKTKTYWKLFLNYWHKIPNALEFLKKNIKEQTTDKISTTNPKEENIFEAFEESLKAENLKSVTINGHINNIDLFKKELPNINEVIKKIENEIESFNKTLFNKTITSLNKFFAFAINDKEELKDIKSKLKDIKDKYSNKF
jgi:tetratricopeptide (TPR) repeat protein